jgi:NTE family protein
VSRQVSLVLSGGIALGAYQAGAYSILDQHQELLPERLAGSSIGAVNAAVIAGNEKHRRVEQLRRFWHAICVESGPLVMPWFGHWSDGTWRHMHNWLSVLQTRFFGRAGAFRPRFPELMLKTVNSAYDLAPLRATLEYCIDFDLLNSGETRLSVVTTDIETGEEVVFDTGRGDRIGSDHLLATCGFLPDFAPVEIDGRLLGDGCLVANAPIETIVLDNEGGRDLLCFVLDLFSAAGIRPETFEDAAARRWELIFGNQTRRAVRALEREIRLRWELARLRTQLVSDVNAHPGNDIHVAKQDHVVTVYHLSYRPPRHEAGPERPFDFSRATLAERWTAGSLDMAEAIRRATKAERPEAGISVHVVERQNGGR